MDRSLFIATSGATQTLLAQTANANNLANAQTTGFKSDLQQFRSMPVYGDGYPTRVYAMTEKPGTDFSQGALQTTDNPLDLAIKGDGFFSVRDSKGKEAYTRAGDFQMTPDGQLLSSSGLAVLDQDGQPIVIPPAEKITISGDGTINIIPFGQNGGGLVPVSQLKLIKPDLKNVEKRPDGLTYIKDGSPQADNTTVEVVQGMIEGSNVSAIGAMVDMIELARNFEMQSNVMKNAKENAAAGSKLLQM
ncbi:MAG: flagellar basal-body rod protein FlgF [Methylococcales bacterium]|nr:flagellar basal-body rod protein FlgF [Methylococcales bacterium]